MLKGNTLIINNLLNYLDFLLFMIFNRVRLDRLLTYIVLFVQNNQFYYLIIMSANQDSYSTVNTFTRRLQLNQIISYVLVLSLFIVFFAAIQNNYENQSTRITMIVLFVIDFLIVLVSGTIASKIDPADPIMLIYRNGDKNEIIKYLDQCLYCQTCRSYVKNTSKHCKICNRCVNKFDHHCAWINNCIGQENYKIFFVMILSTMLYMLLFCVSVGLLYQEQVWSAYYAAFIVSWIFFAFSLVFCALLVALISLHIFLMWRGQTTFEYIMLRRAQAQKNVEKTKQNNNQLNISGETVREKKIQAEVIFQSNSEEGEQRITSHKQLPRLYSNTVNHQDLRKLQKDNQKQLKDFYKSHKSLKYLVGNGVVVVPFRQDLPNYNTQKGPLKEGLKNSNMDFKRQGNYSSMNPSRNRDNLP